MPTVKINIADVKYGALKSVSEMLDKNFYEVCVEAIRQFVSEYNRKEYEEIHGPSRAESKLREQLFGETDI